MNAAFTFVQRFVWAVYRPLDAFDAQKQDTRGPVYAAGAVTLVGVVWAVFSYVLYAAGHHPTFVGNPLPLETYYLWQSMFVLPLLLVGATIFSLLCHTGAGLFGGDGTFGQTFSIVGFAYAVPLLVLFLFTDIAFYAVGGFFEMGYALPISGSATLLWMVLLSAGGMVVAQRVSIWVALAVVIPALIVQGMVVGFLLR